MRSLLVALGALLVSCAPLLVSCASSHTSPAPPAPTSQRPGGATCAAACANLERLGCPEARRSANGLTCVTICERASELQDMRLSCVAGAPSFTALLACETVRCTE